MSSFSVKPGKPGNPNKPRKEQAMPPQTRTAIERGLDEAEAYYAPIAEVWASLPMAQREAYLDASPTLRRLLAFAGRFTSVFLLLAALLSVPLSVLAATRTTVAAGLWSAPTTWDTGVPADGDTAVIGHAVTFDVDQSAFASGVTVTINSGGSLTASTTAGTYYLKCNGNITVSSGGSFLVGSAGTPYPSNCSLTVNLNGPYSFTGAGTIAIYCSEPVVKTLQLNTPTTADATVLDVRVFPTGATWDPTGDPINWVAGQIVHIDNYGSQSSTERNIASATINTLTLTAGTMPAKAAGSLVHLINRNVWITGATGHTFSSAPALTLAAQVTGNAGGLNECSGASITGGIYSVTYFAAYSCNGLNITGGVFSGSTMAVNSCNGVIISGSVISGHTYGLYHCMGPAVSGCFVLGNSTALWNCTAVAITATTISGNNYGMVYCSGSAFTSSFASATADLYACAEMKLSNCLLSSAVENSQYNTAAANPWWYVSSTDHDQVAGAYKAWSKGGIVTSQATTVPPGYSSAYQIALESATYWGFYEHAYAVAPGQTLRWIVYRNQTIDASSKAEIVDTSHDPLLGGTALDTHTFTTATGSWEAGQVEYTNSGTLPTTIKLRVSGKSATGTVYFLPVLVQGRESW